MRPRSALGAVIALSAITACGHHAPAAGAGSAAAATGTGTATGPATATGSAAATGSDSATGSAAATGSDSATATGSDSATVSAAGASPGGALAAGAQALGSSSATPPPAGPAPVATQLAAAALPAGITARGTLESAWTFRDSRGAHYILFSATRTTGHTTGAGPMRSAILYVDAWTVTPGGTPREPLPIRDLVKSCPLAMTAAFHPDAFGVTDLDHDGVAEVTFGYELGCHGDVSPNTYKVGVLVGPRLYMLRGTTRMPPAAGPSGTFTPDPSFTNAPPGVLDHARDVWSRTDADSELR